MPLEHLNEVVAKCPARVAQLLAGYAYHRVMVEGRWAVIAANAWITHSEGEDAVVKLDFRCPHAWPAAPPDIQDMIDGLTFAGG